MTHMAFTRKINKGQYGDNTQTWSAWGMLRQVWGPTHFTNSWACSWDSPGAWSPGGTVTDAAVCPRVWATQSPIHKCSWSNVHEFLTVRASWAFPDSFPIFDFDFCCQALKPFSHLCCLTFLLNPFPTFSWSCHAMACSTFALFHFLPPCFAGCQPCSLRSTTGGWPQVPKAVLETEAWQWPQFLRCLQLVPGWFLAALMFDLGWSTGLTCTGSICSMYMYVLGKVCFTFFSSYPRCCTLTVFWCISLHAAKSWKIYFAHLCTSLVAQYPQICPENGHIKLCDGFQKCLDLSLA